MTNAKNDRTQSPGWPEAGSASTYVPPESGHTPGPWAYDPSGEHYYGKVVRAGGTVIAEIRDAKGSQFNALTPRPEVTLANARLIAAAPDLLAALEWATRFAEGSWDSDPSLDNPKFNEWLDRCREAIVRATGAATYHDARRMAVRAFRQGVNS